MEQYQVSGIPEYINETPYGNHLPNKKQIHSGGQRNNRNEETHQKNGSWHGLLLVFFFSSLSAYDWLRAFLASFLHLGNDQVCQAFSVCSFRSILHPFLPSLFSGWTASPRLPCPVVSSWNGRRSDGGRRVNLRHYGTNSG